MIQGELAELRARHTDDVPVLHAELYEDVVTRSRGDTRPWRPVGAASGHSPYEPREPSDDVAFFSVVERATGELAGEALLWSIDAHNRSAHLGISLRPGSRGRGLGEDVVRLLCRYGFSVRGLHRLQVDTLADNAAMIRAASANGFALEGTLRGSAWVCGEFLDEVVMGLMVEDWRAAAA
ncbi:GNAT family N-acetyltransferase [Streptomyces sp. NBC_00503]|uniref:GNAT family N-acetyltransferase n=1 Tax=Streptomyces sp. NBC_00503 TaxID=2903659 RepID=UPI002E7FE23F|nr:GNAT family protein [Streptomyces sp. NBC_00503]WUD84693.1 GNAT family N-acetyltransferase [Streptomyces sp. NBC_00503]